MASGCWTATTATAPINPPLTDDDGNKTTQAVSRIPWTADPGGGPLPKNASSLTFPAIQGYDEGSTVAWGGPTVQGRPEPEPPAATSSRSRLAVVALAVGIVGLLAGLAGGALTPSARRRAAAPSAASASERDTALTPDVRQVHDCPIRALRRRRGRGVAGCPTTHGRRPGTRRHSRATTRSRCGAGSGPLRSRKEHTTVRSRLPRVLAVVLAALVAVLAVGVGTASAHVNVSSADAARGGYGELTFRVPNESDSASTIKLRVQIPADTPLASVRTKPVPGWTATLTKSAINPPIDVHGTQVSEAVTEITWTADPGAGIKPGEYQTFAVSGGPFPEVDALAFPTVQTYDDGSESAWIEPAVDGQAEPEHPAPVLTLAANGGADAHGGTTDTATGDTAGGDTADSGTSGLTVTALVLGIAGLLAGLAGLALGLAARRRNAAA